MFASVSTFDVSIVFSIYIISKFKSGEEKEKEKLFKQNKEEKERKASHLLVQSVSRIKSMHMQECSLAIFG